MPWESRVTSHWKHHLESACVLGLIFWQHLGDFNLFKFYTIVLHSWYCCVWFYGFTTNTTTKSIYGIGFQRCEQRFTWRGLLFHVRNWTLQKSKTQGLQLDCRLIAVSDLNELLEASFSCIRTSISSNQSLPSVFHVTYSPNCSPKIIDINEIGWHVSTFFYLRKWSRNIQDTSSAILCSHLKPDYTQ